VDLSQLRCVIIGRRGPRSPKFTVVTAELLEELVAGRPPDGPLFVSRRGGALTYRTAADIIAKATNHTVTLRQLYRRTALAVGERGE
jgi:hypothetical protein